MKLGLGTAQFGLDYGVSNSSGKTSPQEVTRILRLAASTGIDLIDTAHAYGDSEVVLGQVLVSGHEFRLVTKIPALCKATLTSEDIEQVRRAVHESLCRLRQQKVYGLLVHNAEDLLIPGSEKLFDLLLELKQQGYADRVGVSVYDKAQIDRIIGRFSIDLIQVPLSVLDQRLVASGHLVQLRQMGVEVHARSIFLQGLLLMHEDQVPVSLSGVRPLLAALHAVFREHDLTPAAGAIQFVRDLAEVHRMVIGVNNATQLVENIDAYQSKRVAIDFSRFACADERITNPAMWRLH